MPATRDPEPSFAHPVERELARVYDELGIAWQYEPQAFVLAQGDDGRVLEAFRPDFYLSDWDVYVECTVARQRLTARKRSKARRAMARYGIRVEIMYRRDMTRLAHRWGLQGLRRALDAAA